MTVASFTSLDFRPGTLASDANSESMLSAWRAGTLELDESGTHFGYVHQGSAQLQCTSGNFTLQAGMYFSAPGTATIGGEGLGIVVTKKDYSGVFLLGGPIEREGRLRYIDGCTDSLLLGPILRGDPCLNLLTIPPHVRQTTHTHPSLRIGLVVKGSGECHTPDGIHILNPGMPFVIWPNRLHSFHTAESSLTVIAYHPDSDFGPTSENHPMINRTVLQGDS